MRFQLAGKEVLRRYILLFQDPRLLTGLKGDGLRLSKRFLRINNEFQNVSLYNFKDMLR